MYASPALAMSFATDVCNDDRPADTGTKIPAAGAQEQPGLLLQSRREARGLTLEDVARRTKIGMATLRALESSDVLHLPAAVYTRGFVRAYASEVGLDAETTADDYLRRIDPERSADIPEDHGGPPPAREDVARGLDAPSVRLLTVVAAGIGLVMYLALSSNDPERARSETGEPPGTPPGVADTGLPTNQDAVPAAFASDAPLRVELVTAGECWLSVSVDGERVLTTLLAAGERRTLEVTHDAVLRVGEPGALSFSINGQAGRALGPAGQPVTVRITRDNFREFLSSL